MKITMKLKVLITLTASLASNSALATFYNQQEIDKQQFIADTNKCSPYEGATLYQLDSFYTLRCQSAATKSTLIALTKTNSFKILVNRAIDIKINGMNTISEFFKENKEEPKCQNV